MASSDPYLGPLAVAQTTTFDLRDTTQRQAFDDALVGLAGGHEAIALRDKRAAARQERDRAFNARARAHFGDGFYDHTDPAFLAAELQVAMDEVTAQFARKA